MRGTIERARGRTTQRKARSEFLRIDEVAAVSGGLGGSNGAAPGMDLVRLKTAWTGVVGPHLGAAAHPVWYRSGGLVVEVKDKAWRRELERFGPEILDRLNGLAGLPRVESLTFRVRAERFSARPRQAVPSATCSGAVPAGPDPAPDALRDLHAPLERIGDLSLRARLTAVVGRYLSRAAAAD